MTFRLRVYFVKHFGSSWLIHPYPVDISGTVVGESPDCLLLSGTVVGENPDLSAGKYSSLGGSKEVSLS